LAAGLLNARASFNYEVLFEDDASDSGQAQAAVTKLIEEDEVSVLLGPTLSTPALAAVPVAQESGIPVVVISNTLPGLSGIGDHVFRVALADQEVVPVALDELVKDHGVEDVALLSGADAHSIKTYDAYFAEVRDAGLEVVVDESFSTGDTEMEPQWTAIEAAEADAVLVASPPQEASAVLKEAAEAGYEGLVVGGEAFNAASVLEQAGETAEGMIVAGAWSPASEEPHSVDFVQRYTAEYGSPPDQLAAQAYTSLFLVARAVESECSNDPSDIRDGLSEIRDAASVFGRFSFDKERNPRLEPVVQVVQDGALVPLRDAN
jgi:branched-chain amino acid transport system substrate-binding protein